ncbi:hypothetical protein HY989_06420 [Candidatus Micrarchaeota archaeon]|nr:hypothetical protein [Candidatus Micrarchaeota archaeon]
MDENEKSMLLKCLGESAEMRIIDFLLENRIFDYSKKQLIEFTGISRATFFAHWKNIEGSGIVKINRQFGKAKLYKLDEKNPAAMHLIQLELALIEGSVPIKREVESMVPRSQKSK